MTLFATRQWSGPSLIVPKRSRRPRADLTRGVAQALSPASGERFPT